MAVTTGDKLSAYDFFRLLIAIAGILSSLSPPEDPEMDSAPFTGWPTRVQSLSFNIEYYDSCGPRIIGAERPPQSIQALNLNYTHPNSSNIHDILQCLPTQHQFPLACFMMIQKATNRPLKHVMFRPKNSLTSLAWNILLLQAGDIEAPQEAVTESSEGYLPLWNVSASSELEYERCRM